MSNKPKAKADPQPVVTDSAEPMGLENRPLTIVALHENALIGQVTYAAGTVLAQVTPVLGVTLEQLCSAIGHGKAGVRPGHE